MAGFWTNQGERLRGDDPASKKPNFYREIRLFGVVLRKGDSRPVQIATYKLLVA